MGVHTVLSFTFDFCPTAVPYTVKSIAELIYPKPLNQAYFYRPMYPMYPYVPLFLCTPREMGVNAIFFQTVDTISKSPYLFN